MPCRFMASEKMVICEEDRLSTLPDEILLKILGKTKSYKWIVRCSCLNKRWNNLSNHVSDFYFDADIWMLRRRRNTEMFEQVMRNALFRCLGDIGTLSFTFFSYSFFTLCMEFAASHNVKHLSIKGGLRSRYPLDYCFSNHFTHLSSCEFNSIYVENAECIPTFLSCSPALQTLTFSWCEFKDTLSIKSSSLTVLDFEVIITIVNVDIRCPNLSSLVLESEFPVDFRKWAIDCPNLHKLSLDYELLNVGDYASNAMELTGIVSSISALKVTDTKVPPSAALWKKLLSFGNLKTLWMEFSCLYFDSLNLGEFKRERDIMLEGHCFYELKEVEMVTISFDRLQKEERWLVMQMLDRSPKLKALRLRLKKSVSDKTVEALKKRISDFKRSSNTLEIEFHGV